MNRFTTKKIIIVNTNTNESITAGTSQRFTKAVLLKIVLSGKYSDFLLAAYGNRNDEYEIKYKNKVLFLGDFAFLKFE